MMDNFSCAINRLVTQRAGLSHFSIRLEQYLNPHHISYGSAVIFPQITKQGLFRTKLFYFTETKDPLTRLIYNDEVLFRGNPAKKPLAHKVEIKNFSKFSLSHYI